MRFPRTLKGSPAKTTNFPSNNAKIYRIPRTPAIRATDATPVNGLNGDGPNKAESANSVTVDAASSDATLG